MALKVVVLIITVYSSYSPYLLCIIGLSIIPAKSQDPAVINQFSCRDICSIVQLSRYFFEGDCSGRDFDSIEQISSCTDVNKVTLRNNAFKHLEPPSDPMELSEVSELDLSENPISRIDSGAFRPFPNVNLLCLMATRVTNLSANSFEGLDSLQRLYAFSGRLQYLDPSAFSGLRHLTTLDLSFNRIKFLPPSLLEDSPNMESLIFSYNKLEILPDALFENMFNLRVLKLNRNRLTSIPSVLATFDNLIEIDLSHNQLTSIIHINTHRLYLQSNMLSFLNVPANTTWRELHLHDNPLQCDHKNERLRKWVIENKRKLGQELVCGHPPEKAGDSLEEVGSLTTTYNPTTQSETTIEAESTNQDPVYRNEGMVVTNHYDTPKNNEDMNNGSSSLNGWYVTSLTLVGTGIARLLVAT